MVTGNHAFRLVCLFLVLPAELFLGDVWLARGGFCSLSLVVERRRGRRIRGKLVLGDVRLASGGFCSLALVVERRRGRWIGPQLYRPSREAYEVRARAHHDVD